MRLSNRIVRGVVAAAAVVTVGTVETSGAGYGVEADASLVGAPVVAEITDQVVGGQNAGVVALVAALQMLCVQCVFEAALTEQIDLVALAECTIICNVAF